MTLLQAAPTFSRIPQREAAEPSPHVDALQTLAACGAAGLILYGLSRRSWTGALLAAAGGWCLLNVVRASSPHSVTRRPSSAPPSLPISEGETVIRAEREPNVAGDPRRVVAVLTAPLAERADPIDGPLTSAEHDAAEVGAYFLALERGGGSLPPYSATWARVDFCRAAGAVRRERMS